MVPGSLDFGIGVIVATFHGVGDDPVSSKILKMVRSLALPVASKNMSLSPCLVLCLACARG